MTESAATGTPRAHDTRQLLWRWGSLLVLFCAFACQSGTPLATLQQKQGTVERDFAAQPRAWKPAEIGASFALGDAIQTLSGSTALLTLDDGAQLSVQSDTLIRFSATPPEPHVMNFEVEVGSASVYAPGGPLSVRTGAGLLQVLPGARVALSRVPDGVRLVVEVGQAVFGAMDPLGVGRGMLIGTDGKPTVLEAPKPPDAPATMASSGDVMAHVTGRRASIRTKAGWTRLDEGSRPLSPGTELELGRGTSVRLERGDERAVLNQNGRYVVAPRLDVLVAAYGGSLSAGSSGRVRIDLPGGVLMVAPEGDASVQLEKQNARIQVHAREVVIQAGRGKETLSPGERAVLAANGELSIEGRSLDYADVEVGVGQSAVIHDPSPPTAVRFLFGDACSETATLQLFGGRRSRQYAAGLEAVGLAIQPGSYRYELRCGPGHAKAAHSRAIHSGKLTVLKDAGTTALAAHPPRTTLQADGRNYTVLYQNRLPSIELTWPSAPPGKQLQLTWATGGRKQSLDLNQPSHTFSSGSLPEGKHVFSFVGGGKVSRQTTVSISFDNAAPTASLKTPAAIAAKAGDPVAIAGTALPGWDVKVGGKPAQRDPQGRFSLDATLPSELRALAIQLSHPQRESHIYLRRAQR